MNKLIHFTTSDWVKGISSGEAYGDGIFTAATGINTFVNPFTPSTSHMGLLSAGDAPVRINSAVVDQTVTAIVPHNSTEIYALGKSGDIYAINTTTHAATLKVALTGIDANSTLQGFFASDGGTEYFYYTNSVIQLGRYNPATGAYTHNPHGSMTTGYSSNVNNHPYYFWAGAHWLSSGDYISKLSGTNLTMLGGAFKLPQNFYGTCFSDDYLHLIIGAATQITSTQKGGQVKIFFWDGYSPSHNKEWVINEPSIQAMKRVGNVIYAICGRAIYAFDYYNAPVMVNPLVADYETGIMDYNAIDVFGNGVLFGGSNGVINFYGQPTTKFPKGYHIPFAMGSGYEVKSINANAEVGDIYVGTTSGLYSLNPNANAINVVARQARTISMNLKKVHLLQRMTVIFGDLLTTGDDVTITVTNKKTQSVSKQFTFTALGAIDRMSVPIALFADSVTVLFTFNGGSVSIKDFIIEGTPTTRII